MASCYKEVFMAKPLPLSKEILRFIFSSFKMNKRQIFMMTRIQKQDSENLTVFYKKCFTSVFLS
jgi:hypothetical protein